MGREYLTWDEVARHSTDTRLICAVLSPVMLEDTAHFLLKLNEVASYCLLSSEFLALWSSWPHIYVPTAKVVRTPKDNSCSHSTLLGFVFSLSLNLWRGKAEKLGRRETSQNFSQKLRK